MTAGSAALNLAYWADGRKVALIAALFALGAALAFPIALFLARLVALGLDPGRRFAAMFLALGIGTGGMTALVFALHFAAYSLGWHEDFHGGLAILFTLAAALYEFAVLGLRLYLPYGLIGLFAFGLWFAARPR